MSASWPDAAKAVTNDARTPPILRQPRRVFSRDQLLEGVWGVDSEAASNVVDVYIGYLRQKLEESGEPRLLQTVRGIGYTLREE